MTDDVKEVGSRDTRALEAELLAGLEGVTPGPWVPSVANAAHIARCSPENIRALLDALSAERERREKAEAWRAEVEALSAEWMEETGQAYCYVGIRDYAAVKERADRLTLLLKEAEEALEPFAEFVADTHPFWDDDRRIGSLNYDFGKLKVGLFRRARTTLSKLKEARHAAE